MKTETKNKCHKASSTPAQLNGIFSKSEYVESKVKSWPSWKQDLCNNQYSLALSTKK